MSKINNVRTTFITQISCLEALLFIPLAVSATMPQQGKTTKMKIIFDLGGVVIRHSDAELEEKLAGFCLGRSKETISKLREIMARHGTNLGGSVRAMHSSLVAELGLTLDYDAFLQVYTSCFELEPGMSKLLEHLSEQHEIYILSNTDAAHWEYIKKNYLDSIKFEIKKAYLSYEMKMLKPDAKIYIAVLSDINAAPDTCLFIDDRQSNVDAANQSGLPALRFTGLDDLVSALLRRNIIVEDNFSHNNLLSLSPEL